MKLIVFLLRASWRTALLAGFVGGISGIASVGLVAQILRTRGKSAGVFAGR